MPHDEDGGASLLNTTIRRMKVSYTTLYLSMVAMLVSGALNTIILKIQNLTPGASYLGNPPVLFYHPFIQCIFMFLGEFLCFFVYAVHIIRKRRSGKKLKKIGTILPKASIYIFAFPAFLDIFVVGLLNVALTMMAASSLQMLKGGTILITAVMSILFLKRKLKPQHWCSMVFIFLGLFLVGKTEAEEEKMAG
jgi:drug/metabolite transporter (DMT)-like permease